MITQSALTLLIGGITPLSVATARQQHNVADIEWTEETNSIANNVSIIVFNLMISLMYKYTRYNMHLWFAYVMHKMCTFLSHSFLSSYQNHTNYYYTIYKIAL